MEGVVVMWQSMHICFFSSCSQWMHLLFILSVQQQLALTNEVPLSNLDACIPHIPFHSSGTQCQTWVQSSSVIYYKKMCHLWSLWMTFFGCVVSFLLPPSCYRRIPPWADGQTGWKLTGDLMFTWQGVQVSVHTPHRHKESPTAAFRPLDQPTSEHRPCVQTRPGTYMQCCCMVSGWGLTGLSDTFCPDCHAPMKSDHHAKPLLIGSQCEENNPSLWIGHITHGNIEIRPALLFCRFVVSLRTGWHWFQFEDLGKQVRDVPCTLISVYILLAKVIQVRLRKKYSIVQLKWSG